MTAFTLLATRATFHGISQIIQCVLLYIVIEFYIFCITPVCLYILIHVVIYMIVCFRIDGVITVAPLELS